jgi:hypothetical protein
MDNPVPLPQALAGVDDGGVGWMNSGPSLFQMQRAILPPPIMDDWVTAPPAE